MAIQTMRPASSLRQCWKEQDDTCPARSNHFWCLLSSSGLDCPKLLPPIPFQGPEFQPEKYFRAPEKCDQNHPRPQKEPKKCKIGGPKKRFRGVRKVARKMEILRQRTEFSQETLPHNSCQILSVYYTENCSLECSLAHPFGGCVEHVGMATWMKRKRG